MSTYNHHHHHQTVPKETAIQALNTIIQLHFEKTLEKKRSVDLQKKQLWRLFQSHFTLLSLLLALQTLSPKSRLQCRHAWIPLSLLSLSHLLFYVAVAQTLRCINGFKYQRRCHKLTLGLATERLKRLKMVVGEVEGEEGGGLVEELEICYQEPPESYLGKFKRSWGLYFGFLILTFGFMVSATVVLLCF
ncbi:hypothetical protein QJS10_CPA08g01319 [Acorus calamus]|uniref:Transmembrane protein n=1 Tax=Acorus calamus TaxID=4465 RepID=A0AAV9ED18_ACOCL|nr:hypothetical protein QJS10_CPA08g01319 [Acorus calamus]